MKKQFTFLVVLCLAASTAWAQSTTQRFELLDFDGNPVRATKTGIQAKVPNKAQGLTSSTFVQASAEVPKLQQVPFSRVAIKPASKVVIKATAEEQHVETHMYRTPEEHKEAMRKQAPQRASENSFMVDSIWYVPIEGAYNEVAVIRSQEGWYSGAIEIPSTVTYGGTEYTVTRIGYGAFRDYISVTAVTLPNTILSIENFAFHYTRIDTITFPEGLVSIGENSFENTSLRKVNIPASVQNIGYVAFANCNNLSSFSVADNNAHYANDALGVLYNKGFTTIIRFPAASTATEFTTPNTVTNIEDFAFDGSQLNEVTFTNALKSIGWNAFRGSQNLVQVRIPESVENISTSPFSQCSSLENILVDDSNVTYTNVEGVLYTKDMTLLVQYPIGNTRTEYSIASETKVIGDEAFARSSLVNITLPEGLEEIQNAAFFLNWNLEEIVIPNSVSEIESSAFQTCNRLKEITLGSGIEHIGLQIFGYCDSISTVNVLTSSAPTITESVFNAVPVEQATLNVVRGTTDAYRADPNWGAFGTINELFNAKDMYEDFEGETLQGWEIITTEGSYTWRNMSHENNKYIEAKAYGHDGAMTVYAIAPAVEIVDGSLLSFMYQWGYFTTAGGSVRVKISENYVSDPAYLQRGVASATWTDITDMFSIEMPTENMSGYLGRFYHSDYAALDAWKGKVVNIAFVYEGDGSTGETTTWQIDNVRIDQGEEVEESFMDNDIFYNVIDEQTVEVGQNADGYAGKIVIPTQAISPLGRKYNVTGIGTQAFYDCDNLVAVTLPEGITHIGDRAFWGADGLASIHIPATVEIIEERALGACFNITEITVATENKAFTSVDGVLYNKDKSILRQYPCDKAGEAFALPNTVRELAVVSMSYAQNLTALDLGNKLEVIGEAAVQNSRLTEIVIPNSVTKIDDWAFAASGNLRNIDFGTGVDTIGIAAFQETALQEVVIPNSVKMLDTQVFALCNALKSVVLGDGIKVLPAVTFYECPNLQSVTLGKSIELVGVNAFYSNYSLANITSLSETPATVELPNLENSALGDIQVWVPTSAVDAYTNDPIWLQVGPINAIGGVGYRFENDQLLYEVISMEPNEVMLMGSTNTNEYGSNIGHVGKLDITETVRYGEVEYTITEIAKEAFWVDRELTSVRIPETVRKINDCAFSNCELLTSITVDSQNAHYTTVDGVLYDKDKSKLLQYPSGKEGESFSVPNTVDSIEIDAILRAMNLREINLPASVKNIYPGALSIGFNLTNINVDAGNENYMSQDGVLYSKDMTTIYAYPCAKKGETFTLPSSVDYVSPRAFYSLYVELREVILPEGVTAIGAIAFQYSSVERVEIPNTVNSINDMAFNGAQIQTIELPEGLKTLNYGMFAYCDRLEEVILPESLEKIESAAFLNTYQLTRVISKASTPPVLVDYFNDYQATLYVPQWVISDYSNTDKWMQFNYIAAIEDIRTFTIDDLDYEAIGTDMDGSKIVKLAGGTVYGELTIPNTVNYLDQEYVVRFIEDSAFEGYWGITGEVIIPDSVWNIGAYAFSECGAIEKVIIGELTNYIGEKAFDGCDQLTSIMVKNEEPAYLTPNAFDIAYLNLVDVPVYVPCSTFRDYVEHPFWSKFDHLREQRPYEVNIISDNEIKGQVEIVETSDCDAAAYTVSFKAMPTRGYLFIRWNDGVEDAERTITVTQDTTIIANFEVAYTIAYDANGGEGQMTPQNVAVGRHHSLAASTYTNGELQFAGWATNANGEVEYEDGEEIINLGAADEVVTLYAVWRDGSSIDGASQEIIFNQVGNMILFNEARQIKVFNVVGQAVYSGLTNSYELPQAPGVYIIHTDRGEFKVTRR